MTELRAVFAGAGEVRPPLPKMSNPLAIFINMFMGVDFNSLPVNPAGCELQHCNSVQHNVSATQFIHNSPDVKTQNSYLPLGKFDKYSPAFE